MATEGLTTGSIGFNQPILVATHWGKHATARFEMLIRSASIQDEPRIRVRSDKSREFRRSDRLAARSRKSESCKVNLACQPWPSRSGPAMLPTGGRTIAHRASCGKRPGVVGCSPGAPALVSRLKSEMGNFSPHVHPEAILCRPKRSASPSRSHILPNVLILHGTEADQFLV